MTGFQNPVSAVSVVGGVAVTNPADIGLSTAQQANVLGVPGTFQGALIVNVQIPTSGVTQYTLSPNMGLYASLSIRMYNIGLPQLVTFTWLDALAGNIVSQRTYLATGNVGAGGIGGAALVLTLPVESPTLRIDFSRGAYTALAGTTLIVYGSNRLHVEAVKNADLGVDYTSTQTWSTTTPFLMGAVTTNGGNHQARMLTNSTGTAYFGYQTCDSLGNLKFMYIFKTSAGQDAYQQVILPRGCIALYVLGAVAASFTAEFGITPTS